MNAPVPPPRDHTPWQGCVLATVAGYADGVGFLKSGAFAGLMTGNTVLLGIALVQGHFAQAAHSAAIIGAFLGGVAIAAALLRHGAKLPLLLLIEALLLVAAALTPYPFTAPTLAVGMGFQNAAATRFAGAVLNTVFLTGDLQKLVQALLPASPHQVGIGRRTSVWLIGSLWLSYLAGCGLGAAAFGWTDRPLLLAPLALPLVLLPVRGASRRP